jgi:PAS domain S-box-containing protein
MSTAEIPMSDGRTIAPPLAMEHAAKHSHVVQFYGGDESLLDAVTRFIGGALGAGDPAIVVASSSHREGLARKLKAYGLDTAPAAREGRYVSLDATEALSKFMVQGWPDAARFSDFFGGIIAGPAAAAKGGNGSVAIFGEMVAILWAEGKSEAAIQLEQLWNDLRETHSFSLLCAYPIAAFNRTEYEEPFLRICAGHSGVVPMEDYTALLNEEQRLLNISHLQQKARALETSKLEREEARKALKSREAELADFLENALEGLQQTGPDQRIVWANRALLKLLGYTTNEYFGHHLAEFYADKRNFDEFWAKLMRREEVYDYPADFICKDGSTKHVLIHSNGLWDGGRFLHTRTFIRDITERKEMEQALQLAHDELEMHVNERTAELNRKNVQILRQSEMLEMTNQGLRELSARLMQVQDEERRRIARDLHDSTGQALALLSMNLSVLEVEARRSSPEMAKGLSENAEIVRQVSTELRTLSYLLHPPLLEEMGLESALRWYIDGFGQRSGIKVHLQQSDLGRLSRDLEIAIFRMVQECLTNVHRHSGSSTARIRLYPSAGTIILEVKDEGKGISPDVLSRIASAGAPGVGLRGLRERIKDFGGELEIASHGKGTEIKIVLPMAPQSPKR